MGGAAVHLALVFLPRVVLARVLLDVREEGGARLVRAAAAEDRRVYNP